ncbi:MAG: sensor histidine kinase [Candidatus Helarchaeota archaeon]
MTKSVRNKLIYYDEEILLDIPIPIILLDINYNIITCNIEFEKLFGLKREDLINENIFNVRFIHKRSRDKLYELMSRFSRREKVKLNEIYGYNSDGTIIYLNLYINYIKNSQIRFFQLIFKEINYIKEVEVQESTKEEYKIYRLFFDYFPFPIILLDFNGVIIDYNRKFENNLKIPKDELIGKKIYDIFKNKEIIKKDLMKYFNKIVKGEVTKLEYKLKNDKGLEIWFDSYFSFVKIGQNKYIQVISQDVTDRKLSEQKLKESEEMFRKISDQSLMGICIIQDNSIKYINKKCADILGYEINELLSWKYQEIYNLIHPEDRELVLKQLYKKQKGEPDVINHYNYRIIRKTGEVVWIENFSRTINFNGKPADLIVIKDETKRIKMEEALKESGEKYRLISENANDMIAIINHKYKYEYINEANKKIMGYSSEELVGRYAIELVHPDDVKKATNILQKGFQNGDDGIIEIRVKDKWGNYKWLEIRGQVFTGKNGKQKAILISRDITKRKKIEQSLQENVRKMEIINHIIIEGSKATDLMSLLEIILECSMDFMNCQGEGGWIYLIDDKIEYANLYYYKGIPKKYMDKIRRVNINDLSCKDIFVKEKTACSNNYSQIIQDMVEKGIIKRVFSFPIFEKTTIIGSINIALINKDSFSIQEKNILEYIGRNIGILISKIRAEDEILRQNEELKELDRLKDEFFADVSHEFRTPLTSIKGFTELLIKMSNNLTDDQVDFLNTILKNEKRLEKLVNELMNYSRLKAGKIEFKKDKFKVSEVVKEIKTEIEPLLKEKDLNIIEEYNPDIVINLDKTQISRIIINLLSNAIKFSFKGGNIYIRSQIKDNVWTFSIKDEGIGIKKEKIPKLFKRFFKLPDSKSMNINGIGIGLAMCKRIIENYNGKIWSESEGLNKGATFYFSIKLD